MNATKKISRLLAGFALATGLLLGLSGTTIAFADQPITTSQQSQAAPAKPVFDGKPAYDAALSELAKRHFTLVDPAKRAAWVAEWQHKFDNTEFFKTEEGTDKAMFMLAWSLGQRFDYYNPPAANTAEDERFNSTLAGVGLTVRTKGLAKAIKALGDKPTEDQMKAVFKLADDRPLMVADDPEEGTPAFASHNLKKGDRILSVDGVSVNGLTSDEAVNKIRGKEGTTVTLTINRVTEFSNTTFDVKLTRAKFPIKVVHTDDLGAGVLHVRLSHFGSQFGSEEMAQALSATTSGKVSGLVLDLRGNPGGMLDQVIEMAQMIMDEGTIVSQLYRQGDKIITITHKLTPTNLIVEASVDGKVVERTVDDRIKRIVPKALPMIVLINEGSASASEILSGALQDSGRALVVGQPTHGKGVGQTVIKLPLNRNMHVTSFEFRPGGIAMDWIGVVPDVEVKLPEDADTVEDPSTDTQLTAAKLEMIRLMLGEAAPVRDPAEMNARRQELKKIHEDEFVKEVEGRKKAIEEWTKPKSAAPAADSATTDKQ